MKERRDPEAAQALNAWLIRTRTTFEDHIVDVTESVALEWGRLSTSRTRRDADGLIAATAIAYALTVVTRNTADFADTGVALVNPWDMA